MKLRKKSSYLKQTWKGNQKGMTDDLSLCLFMLNHSFRSRVFNTQNRNTKRGRSISHNPTVAASSRISDPSPPRNERDFEISSSPMSFGSRPISSTPIGINIPLRGMEEPQGFSPPVTGVAMSCSPSTSLLSSSFVESFLQSRAHESASRSCL